MIVYEREKCVHVFVKEFVVTHWKNLPTHLCPKSSPYLVFLFWEYQAKVARKQKIQNQILIVLAIGFAFAIAVDL